MILSPIRINTFKKRGEGQHHSPECHRFPSSALRLLANPERLPPGQLASSDLFLRLRAARMGVCLKMNFAKIRSVLQVMTIFLISENSFHFLGLDAPMRFRYSHQLPDMPRIRRFPPLALHLLLPTGEAFQGKVCSPLSGWLQATFAMRNQTKYRKNEQ